MNLEHLKRDIGYRVRLVPPAYHLDAAGEPLPMEDGDWIIMADIRGADVTAVPNHQPGAPVPPPVNRALKARATFVPELERVFRGQVRILDRVVVNFSVTANDLLGNHQAIRPGDTWESLKPIQPQLFPHAAVYRDLWASDAELLAEFYGAVSEVADLIQHWTGTVALTEYNAWNVLMHKVQHSLRMGELAVQKLCPDRAYDATMPAGGKLLSQSQRVLTSAEKAREVFMTKLGSSQQRKPVPDQPRH